MIVVQDRRRVRSSEGIFLLIWGALLCRVPWQRKYIPRKKAAKKARPPWTEAAHSKLSCCVVKPPSVGPQNIPMDHTAPNNPDTSPRVLSPSSNPFSLPLENGQYYSVSCTSCTMMTPVFLSESGHCKYSICVYACVCTCPGVYVNGNLTMHSWVFQGRWGWQSCLERILWHPAWRPTATAD